jgi:hypothetical protein
VSTKSVFFKFLFVWGGGWCCSPVAPVWLRAWSSSSPSFCHFQRASILMFTLHDWWRRLSGRGLFHWIFVEGLWKTTKELSWPEIRANSFSTYVMTLLFCEIVYSVKFRNLHSAPNISLVKRNSVRLSAFSVWNKVLSSLIAEEILLNSVAVTV